MKRHFSLLLLLAFSSPSFLEAKRPEATWRKLLQDHADCVTWVSATVRVEVSAGGRSMPPQEQKLEALGTIIAEDGLTVLSLSRVDPTATLLSRMRGGGGTVNVNYTEVLILMQDGTEVPARLVLKDSDLDLAFVLPLKGGKSEADKISFPYVPRPAKDTEVITRALDEVVSLGKLSRNLYRQSTLRKGWVSAVIEKPRKYLVIDNTSPGTPVFDREGNWLGIVVYKMDRGRPTSIVTLPAEDIDEIAEQVRSRNK